MKNSRSMLVLALVVFTTIVLITSCSDPEIVKDYYDTGELRSVTSRVGNDEWELLMYGKDGKVKLDGHLYRDSIIAYSYEYSTSGRLLSKNLVDANYAYKGLTWYYNKQGKLIEKSYIEEGEKYFTTIYDGETGRVTTSMFRPIATLLDSCFVGKPCRVKVALPFTLHDSLPYRNDTLFSYYKFGEPKDSTEILDDLQRFSLHRSDSDTVLSYTPTIDKSEISCHFYTPALDKDSVFIRKDYFFDIGVSDEE